MLFLIKFSNSYLCCCQGWVIDIFGDSLKFCRSSGHVRYFVRVAVKNPQGDGDSSGQYGGSSESSNASEAVRARKTPKRQIPTVIENPSRQSESSVEYHAEVFGDLHLQSST